MSNIIVRIKAAGSDICNATGRARSPNAPDVNNGGFFDFAQTCFV